MSRRCVLATGALLAMAACGPREVAGPQEYAITAIDTLITETTNRLAKPYEVALGPDGAVYVTDVELGSIIALSPEGTFQQAIGRTGAGPGELKFPRSTRVFGDSILVVNSGNGRLEMFRASGELLGSRPLPAAAVSGAVDLLPSGAMLVSTNGEDSALARRLTGFDSLSAKLGAPVAPMSAMWDFTAIKQEIAAGTVPAQIRSITLPVLAPDGSAWLVLAAEGLVQRYGPSDSLEWSRQLVAPELAQIKAAFFEANRRLANPNAFATLAYVVDAEPVGSGLWLLLRMPDEVETVILVLDAAGQLSACLRIPPAKGVRAMAIDQERRVIYLVAYEDAVLLRAALPKELVAR